MGYKAGMTHVVREVERPGSSKFKTFYSALKLAAKTRVDR